ncbi:MAG: hypothetical protein CMN32_09280 [Saprospirales bacterium]|nr:hypothetical protein [Saprospirales bacterium]
MQHPPPYRPSDSLQQHRYPGFLFRWPWLIDLLHGWNWLVHPRNRIVWRFFHCRLRQLEAGAKVLDAGFGDGQHLFPAVKAFPGLQFTGLDKLEAHLRFAKRYFGKSPPSRRPELLCAGIEALPPGGHYDLVLCCGTLQYLKDDLAGLRAIRQAMNARGRLLLYVPVNNLQVLPWYHWLQMRFGHYDEKQKKRAVYTVDALREKCREAGFQLIAERMTNGPAGILANEWYNTWLMLAGNAGRLSWLLLPLTLPLVLPVLPLQWLDDLLPKEKGNGVLMELQMT